MEIRRLQEGEIPALVDELWLPFSQEMAALDPYNELADDGVREHALDHREKQCEDDSTVIFVAADGDSLAGHAVAQYSESAPVFARGPAVNLGELYVRPERREAGLATALVERVETWATAHDAERIKLSVNDHNQAARSLYEELGFSVRRLKLDKAV